MATVLIEMEGLFEGTPEQFEDTFGAEEGGGLSVSGLADWAELHGAAITITMTPTTR